MQVTSPYRALLICVIAVLLGMRIMAILFKIPNLNDICSLLSQAFVIGVLATDISIAKNT